MVYCSSLEPAELPSRSKSMETLGEFGNIVIQPHASGFTAKLCAVPGAQGALGAAESCVL